MARVKPGVIVDGVSLLGLLKRRTWTETRDSIVLEAGPFDKPSQEYTGLRTSRYMFAVYGNGEEELYDLQVDPYELENRVLRPCVHGCARGADRPAPAAAVLRRRYLSAVAGPTRTGT